MFLTDKFKYIAVLLSLLVGITAYNFFAYNASTLVMEVKTFEHGARRLAITGYDGKQYTRSFELNGKWGINSSEPGKRMYVVELPATKLKEIKIEPLALPGAFEINKITISDDTVSYSWDELGVCSKKTWRPAVEKSQKCSNDSPDIKIAGDGSIDIVLIKDIGRENSLAQRSLMALIMFVGCMLSFWLLRKSSCYGNGVIQWNKLGIMSVWLVLAIGYSYQLFLVCKYAMDVPYFDEWDYFDLKGKLCIPDKLSIAWLFDFWSEHIIVPTKLMTWVNLKLFSLNLVYDKIFNYIVYGFLLLVIIGLKVRITGKGVFTYFPAFLIFLLSPLPYENHLWGFQSQYHLLILLSVVPLYFAYHKQPTYTTAALFCLPLLVNIFTFGAGVIVAVIYMVCYCLHIAICIQRKHIHPVFGWKIIILCALPVIICACFRFHGYEKAGWTPSPISPLTYDFWVYFSNILSLGFGFTEVNVIPGIICFMIVLLPLVRLVINKKTRWEAASLFVITVILGVIAILGAISYGRGGFNEPKTARYAEYGLMLIPMVSLAWWLALESKLSRLIVISLLWIGLFFSFIDSWSAQHYREKKQMDVFHLECIENYFEGTGDGVCQGDKRGLDRAAQLGVSFTKQFMTARKGNGTNQ